MRVKRLIGAMGAATISASICAASPIPLMSGISIVGIVGLESTPCADDTCTAYGELGSIVSVDVDDKTGRPTGFKVISHGVTKYENMDTDWSNMSRAEVSRIRTFLTSGEEVFVIGNRVGQKQIEVPTDIISANHLRSIVLRPAHEK